MVLKQKILSTDVGDITVNELSYRKFCELQKSYIKSEEKSLNNIDMLKFALSVEDFEKLDLLNTTDGKKVWDVFCEVNNWGGKKDSDF